MRNSPSCQIMGILNVTPDSFSDGGKFDSVEKALKQVKRMVKEGVNIIDIGGESTGPGSKNISLEKELNRVIPLIKTIKSKNIDIPLSIDTYKAEVAREALELGVTMVNDVTALRGDPNMKEVLGKYKPYVVLMYAKDKTARTTLGIEKYKDVISTITRFLMERVRIAVRYGIPREKIILDPGMGAFVSGEPKYSYEIIHQIQDLKDLGYPVLISPSKKSFLGGKITDRKFKTIGAASICAYNGADYVRVHDVKECKDAVEIAVKIRDSGNDDIGGGNG